VCVKGIVLQVSNWHDFLFSETNIFLGYTVKVKVQNMNFHWMDKTIFFLVSTLFL